jgi:CRP-like cAMP-binding protein
MSDVLHQNALLARLPSAELEVLRPLVTVADVQLRDGVYAPRQAIEEVYFPLTAVFSMVATAGEDRVVVEVGTVGYEGMVGLPLFLGSPVSPHAAFCQIAGSAARLPAAELHGYLARDGSLHRLLNRFTQTTMVQLAQNVACNQVHTLEQRMARWLLTTADRVRADTFLLTQEFLSQMLGVSRPSVSETASKLQTGGIIRYSRGHLRIVDRPALLRLACDCYRVLKAEFEALASSP